MVCRAQLQPQEAQCNQCEAKMDSRTPKELKDAFKYTLNNSNVHSIHTEDPRDAFKYTQKNQNMYSIYTEEPKDVFKYTQKNHASLTRSEYTHRFYSNSSEVTSC